MPIDDAAGEFGVAEVLADFRDEFLDLRTSLDADVWCSSLLVGMSRDQGLDADGVDEELRTVVGAVVRLVHERPTWEAVAFLRVLTLAMPASERDAAEAAVAEAAGAGIPEPSWARRAPLVAGPCWHAQLSSGLDLVSLVLERGGEGHVFTVEVEPPGILADIALATDVEDVRREQADVARRSAGVEFAELTPAEAWARVEPALGLPPGFPDRLGPQAIDDRFADLVVLRAHLDEAIPR